MGPHQGQGQIRVHRAEPVPGTGGSSSRFDCGEVTMWEGKVSLGNLHPSVSLPPLPIKAGHQQTVTAANPNQACSTGPLRPWTLLCGVKITLPAWRELGVQAGACRVGDAVPTTIIIPAEAQCCAGAHRAVIARLCSPLPASSHQGSKPG